MATPERFDVLVVGAGPAGMAAACAASGALVVAPTISQMPSVGLVDDNPAAGGQIWRGGMAPAGDRLASNLIKCFGEIGVRRLHGTQIVARPAPGVLLGERDGQPVELHYGKLILATGARERFIPFPGWTLPNVFGAGGLQALVKSGLQVKGKRIIVAGSGPLLLSVAACLKDHGAVVPLVAEQAPWHRVARFGLQLIAMSFGISPSYRKLRQAAAYRWALRGTRYLSGCWPTAAHGGEKIEAATLQCRGRTWTEPCDMLACGFGLVPNFELPMLLGCEVREGAVVVDDWQESTVRGIYCAGELTGVGGAELAIAEGIIAGLAAIGEQQRGHYLSDKGLRYVFRVFAKAMDRAFRLRPELRDLPDDDTLICRCEDVTRKRLQGYSSWRAAKLHTRCGMGPCQGRVCGAAAEFLFGWKNDSVRPPILPTSVGTLAGEDSKDENHESNE